MKAAYLLYHRNVHSSQFPCGFTVYHDSLDHNQDPYVWNKQFLHTYCHMDREGLRKLWEQRKQAPEKGDLYFWVNAGMNAAGKRVARKDYTVLLCDLVFEVKDVSPWKHPNLIKDIDSLGDPISKEAYEDHYQWPERNEHYYTEEHLRYGPRVTLKADPSRSFQPLDEKQNRIDILVDFLSKNLTDEDLEALRKAINFNAGTSYPFPLDLDVARSLYNWLKEKAFYKRRGEELQPLRQQYPEQLGSDGPKPRRRFPRKQTVFEKSMACSCCPLYPEC